MLGSTYNSPELLAVLKQRLGNALLPTPPDGADPNVFWEQQVFERDSMIEQLNTQLSVAQAQLDEMSAAVRRAETSSVRMRGQLESALAASSEAIETALGDGVSQGTSAVLFKDQGRPVDPLADPFDVISDTLGIGVQSGSAQQGGHGGPNRMKLTVVLMRGYREQLGFSNARITELEERLNDLETNHQSQLIWLERQLSGMQFASAQSATELLTLRLELEARKTYIEKLMDELEQLGASVPPYQQPPRPVARLPSTVSRSPRHRSDDMLLASAPADGQACKHTANPSTMTQYVHILTHGICSLCGQSIGGAGPIDAHANIADERAAGRNSRELVVSTQNQIDSGGSRICGSVTGSSRSGRGGAGGGEIGGGGGGGQRGERGGSLRKGAETEGRGARGGKVARVGDGQLRQECGTNAQTVPSGPNFSNRRKVEAPRIEFGPLHLIDQEGAKPMSITFIFRLCSQVRSTLAPMFYLALTPGLTRYLPTRCSVPSSLPTKRRYSLGRCQQTWPTLSLVR